MFLLKVIGTSLFVGMLIAWSGGSVFPPLFNVAAPFVCDGKFSVVTEEFYPRPGEVDTTQTVFCDSSKSGSRNEITFPTIIVAGLIYSGIVFVPALVLSLRKRGADATPNVVVLEKTFGTGPSAMMAETQDQSDPGEKLKKLNALKDAGLITEQEYQTKRAEVLSKI